MTKVLDKAIAAFVTDVRAALGGQDPDVIADLTDNLEADLLDRQAAEGDDFKLGNPKVYANELLASAGLLSVAGADSRGRRFWRAVGGAVWRFLGAVRPTWWVFRGYISYVVITWLVIKNREFFPHGAGGWVLLFLLMLVSIAIGRASGVGVWRQWWLRVPLAMLNILAVLVSLFWAGEVNQTRQDYGQMSALYYSDLLIHNGQVVSFAYAYDKNGRQLPMVRLQDGNGALLYESPAETVMPDVLSGLVGGTLKNAIGVLTFLKYTSVNIDYQHVSAFKPGHVASVQLATGQMGETYVQLVVSK